MSQSASARRRVAPGTIFITWAELALCLGPVTAGWVFGAASALRIVVAAFEQQGGGPLQLIAMLIPIGLACAALGLVALWSLLLPQAFGRPLVRAPRGWQLTGLAGGFLSGAVGLLLVLAGTFGASESRLGWAYLFASPIVVATHVALQFAIRGIPDREPS